MKVAITQDLSVLKVSGSYPEEVDQAYNILAQFRQVELGSIWGLDGVAEYCANLHKSFTLNKSGISKRQAKQWIKEKRAEVVY